MLVLSTNQSDCHFPCFIFGKVLKLRLILDNFTLPLLPIRSPIPTSISTINSNHLHPLEQVERQQPMPRKPVLLWATEPPDVELVVIQFEVWRWVLTLPLVLDVVACDAVLVHFAAQGHFPLLHLGLRVLEVVTRVCEFVVVALLVCDPLVAQVDASGDQAGDVPGVCVVSVRPMCFV